MKVLVLFAFAVLGCSLAGARKVSKCELKQQLAVVFNSLPDNIKQSGLSGDNFLAKVVCHVEQLSGFNTGAVTQLGKQSQESSESGSASDEGGKSTAPSRKQRSAQKQGGKSKEDNKGVTPGLHVENHSGFNTGAVTQQGKQSQESSESGSASHEGVKSTAPSRKQRSAQKQNDNKAVTLYGLFQLPEGLVCSNNNNTLPNLCGISCNQLTDDDISDDISCVVKLLTDIVKNGFMTENSRKVWDVVKQLIDDKCKNLNQYFSEC